MNLVFIAQPVLALVAGVVILIAPNVLNYAVAGFLILSGLFGLLPHLIA